MATNDASDPDDDFGHCGECGRAAPLPGTGCKRCQKFYDALVEAHREPVLEKAFDEPLFPFPPLVEVRDGELLPIWEDEGQNE